MSSQTENAADAQNGQGDGEVYLLNTGSYDSVPIPEGNPENKFLEIYKEARAPDSKTVSKTETAS